MEQRTLSLQIRNSDIENRTISGYAAVFGENYTQLCDRWGDVFFEKISPGAFTKTLSDENDKFMLINHDWNKVVGRTNSNLTLSQDTTGLAFTLEVPNTADGNDLLENVRLGLIKGCSFGFNIVNQECNWDDDYNFYRNITEVELLEITATPIPAYSDTTIAAARSKTQIESIKEMRNKEIENRKQVENPENQNEPENRGKELFERNAGFISAFFNAFK